MKIYSARIIKASNNWLDKRCFYCNEYFKNGDEITLVIPCTELKVQYKKLQYNILIHSYEFNKLVALYGENEAIMQLAMHKAPKKSLVLTDLQQKNLEAFRKACDSCGFIIETDAMRTETLYKRRKQGSSLTFVYNPLTDKIKIRRRGNKGLLDGLYEQELASTLFNKMHEILGDGKVDNFSANEIINKAITDVNNMFK